MPNENFVDAWMRDISDALVVEADRLGADIADDVRRRLSVPVAGSGARAIRSKPGEPPRREFGKLRTSVDHRVIRVGAERIALRITAGGSLAPYAPILEKKLNRDILRSVPARWGDRAAERLRRAATSPTR